MVDIVQFLKRRRESFKNPCFRIEPLMDWINWSASNGTLFHISTNPGTFEGMAIAWKVNRVEGEKNLDYFIKNYDPTSSDYDLFILDFFCENAASRRILIDKIRQSNKNHVDVWCLRKGDIGKIKPSYINLFYKLQWEAK
jgi:hypothetical protein